MKKLSVFMISFLLLTSTFVSAGFLGEGWNFLMTGATVEEPVEDTIIESNQEFSEQDQDVIEEESSTIEGEFSEGYYPSEEPPYVEQNQGSYCGDGACNLEDGEQYSWCPVDCTEDQTQDTYRKGDYEKKDFQKRPYEKGPGEYHGQRQCPEDKEMYTQIRGKCEKYGGTVTERVDPYSGCKISECFFSGEGTFKGGGEFGEQGDYPQGQGVFGEGACQSEEDAAKQSELCAEFGTEPIAVPSPPGCAPRIVCAQKGQGYGTGHLSYDEYRHGQERFERGEIGSAQVLEAILKMDSIKIQLEGVQKRMLEIAAYYDTQGDSENAAHYKEGAAILDQVAVKIDEQKTALKSAIESGNLDYATIYQIRSDLKYSVDELLNQVISALLGVSYTGIAEEDVSDTSCETNSLCFEEYFRTCAVGAQFNPEAGVSVEIEERTEEDTCILAVDMQGVFGRCTVPNYRFAKLSKESVLPYCEDALQKAMGEFEEQEFSDSSFETEFEEDVESVPSEEEIILEPVPEETCVDVDANGICDTENISEEPVAEETLTEEATITEEGGM